MRRVEFICVLLVSHHDVQKYNTEAENYFWKSHFGLDMITNQRFVNNIILLLCTVFLTNAMLYMLC